MREDGQKSRAGLRGGQKLPKKPEVTRQFGEGNITSSFVFDDKPKRGGERSPFQYE